MAAPHVSGLVALLWSADASLIGDIDGTEEIITSTALEGGSPDDCGGSATGQRHDSGFGLINAYEAIRQALRSEQ